MAITRKDEDLLMWFFERGVCTFWRSTFGTMLERTQALAYDSNGRRIPKSTAWSSGAELRVRERRQEASYEPDDHDLLRVARVSRRLRLVAACDPAAERALEAYYGAEGARCARADPGRIFALYPLTKAGERFVRDDVAKRPESADDAHGRLLAEVQLQQIAPTPQRRELLARIHTQAERLLASAWNAWVAIEVAPPADATRAP